MRIKSLNLSTWIVRSVVSASLGLLVPVTAASAQAASEQTSYRTRAYLDSVASQLERTGKRDDALAIRERLQVGDFYPGDRLVVDLLGGEEPFRDTVSVRTGQEIVISMFPAFNLKGVLRSEADSALAAQAKRYIQRPVVRTQPLVRLLVTGAVGRPGFVTVRGDAAVSDVVSTAGGLTSMSRIDKSQIKRGSDVLVEKDSLSVIFRTGMTLDQADIRAGDEFSVKEKKQSNYLQLVWAGSAAFGLIVSMINLTR